MQMAHASRHPVAKVLYAGLEHRNSVPSMGLQPLTPNNRTCSITRR
jgi:hypothetical protein